MSIRLFPGGDNVAWHGASGVPDSVLGRKELRASSVRRQRDLCMDTRYRDLLARSGGICGSAGEYILLARPAWMQSARTTIGRGGEEGFGAPHAMVKLGW